MLTLYVDGLKKLIDLIGIVFGKFSIKKSKK
jgi:hypothetical protein